MSRQRGAGTAARIMVLAVVVLALQGAAASAGAGSATRTGSALKKAWQVRLRGEDILQADALVLGRDVLVISSAEFGTVWAFDLASRRVLWERGGPGHARPTQLVDGDLLIEEAASPHSDARNALARLDRRTGKRKWRYRLPGDFGEEGYVAVAGDLACLGFSKGDRGDDSLSPNAWVVIDLRTGRPISPQPRYPAHPLSFYQAGLADPPRFLTATPYLPELGDSSYHGPAQQTFRLLCLDARKGTTMWTAEVGRVTQEFAQSRRVVQDVAALGALALCAIGQWSGSSSATELTWISTADGRVVKRSRLTGDSRPPWALPVAPRGGLPPRTVCLTPGFAIDMSPVSAWAKAGSLGLADLRLLALQGLTLSLRPADDPEKVLWRANLASILPPGVKRVDSNLQVTIAWPFALLVTDALYTDPKEKHSAGIVTALVDLRKGTLRRVLLSQDLGGACLDPARGALYTLVSGTLTKYGLPAVGARRKSDT